MKKPLLILLILLLSPLLSHAQWKLLQNTAGIYYSSIRYCNNRIYIMSGNRVFTSVNFGDTWNLYKATNRLSCIECNDNAGYYIPEYGYAGIYTSTNNGVTWEMIFKSNARIFFVYDNYIWRQADDSPTYVSSDNGKTWDYTKTDASSLWPRSFVKSGDTVFCSAIGDQIYRLKVGKEIWKKVSNGLIGGTFDIFASNHSVFAIPTDRYYTPVHLYKFSNEMNEWNIIDMDTFIVNNQINDIEQVRNYYIFANSKQNITITDGIHFEQATYGLNGIVNEMIIINDQIYACTDNGIYVVKIDELMSYIGVSEDRQSNHYFYPNPASGVLNIRTEAEAGTRAKAVVTDLLGNAVQSVEFESCPAELQIRLEGLAAGTYCVTVYSNGQKSKSEMIIKY